MIKTILLDILANEHMTLTRLATRLNVSYSMLTAVINENRHPGALMIAGLNYHYPKQCRAYLKQLYRDNLRKPNGSQDC